MVKIKEKKKKKLSKWVTLVKKKFVINKKIETWYYLKTFDYISIFAINERGKIAIVNQYRPAINKKTWEFPGGLKDSNLSIYKIAKQEVEEETGLKVKKLIKLKTTFTDTGRIDNKVHLFFAKCFQSKNRKKIEDSVKVKFVTYKELLKLINKGKFNYNLHISLMMFVKNQKLI